MWLPLTHRPMRGMTFDKPCRIFAKVSAEGEIDWTRIKNRLHRFHSLLRDQLIDHSIQPLMCPAPEWTWKIRFVSISGIYQSCVQDRTLLSIGIQSSSGCPLPENSRGSSMLPSPYWVANSHRSGIPITSTSGIVLV